MKKLHVKTEKGWEMVFCHNNGVIITTPDRSKALPQNALKYFQSRFANHEFKLEMCEA